jgi:hypothetical protein
MTRIADLLACDFSRPIEETVQFTNDDPDFSAIAAVLRKKESQELILRKLFRDKGASLMQSVRLERCSRRTEFDEDQFVQFYPYLPHLLDLSIDIMAGIRLNRNIVRQCWEMLVSDRARLANLPVEALVSIDKIYDLVEENLPPQKQKYILEIRQRFDNDQDYPGMAGRVVKAICLMEFAKTDPPCTTRNIAALLVQRVTEAPPILAVAAILSHLKEAGAVRETNHGWRLFDFELLRNVADALEGLRNAVGKVNPRPPGWHNDLIQVGKRLLARLFNWYTRPLQEYNAAVSRAIEEIVCALDRLSTDMMPPDQAFRNASTLDQVSMNSVALEARLARSENRSAGANDKTTYIIGLFGTGRRYINELILQNIGERAKYFMDGLRLHPGPTPMIYSGHATMRYASRAQEPPAVMSGILESVRSGFADSIFVYRHPLDSLLTNWIWWRTYLRDNRWISGISQVYSNTDDLCADLEQNFCEFETFAEGDPDFFVSLPGPPFLSFAQFVEETELHMQAATLTLRLEDFMVDPSQEFSKIVAVMSANVDLSALCVPPPITKPYGHLVVKEKVPRFRHFIHALEAETKRRIDEIGYKGVG